MLSVSFFINNAKKDKHGKVPVTAKVYRSEQDKATIYTKVRVSPKHWDGFKVLDGEVFSAEYNALLERMKADILLQCATHVQESAGTIKQFYLDSFKIKCSIGDLLKTWFNYMIGSMSNKETIRTYHTHQRVLNTYLKSTQLYTHDASKFAYQEGRIIYQKVLKDGKSVIYANKLMRKVRAAIEWGVGERKTDSNMFEGFKLKSIPKNRLTSRDYLSLEEIARLISCDAPARYTTAKVLATRQLFTGMAYADAMAFTPDKVTTWNDKKVLIGNRIKTNEEYIVPLDMVASAVCEGHGWKTKKLSNCTYNEHLKVLAAYAGISKNVTTHMLRRSFAQNMRDSGVSDEVVAKMLGHVDTRMLKFYSVVSQYRVTTEYDRLAA